MTKPKILLPQALPAIFSAARDEANWLIFAIGVPDAKGKKPKRPVAKDKPYIWTNRDKAAGFTYDAAVKRMKAFADGTFGSLEDINRKVKARRDDMIAEGKKPGPEITVEGYALGYFAREDSALIALDFDNVAHDGEVEDFELMALLEETTAYAEVSSSGTGVRVFMPREFADMDYHAGERNNVGLFVSSKGAACALTFATLANGTERDQWLFDLVLERHGKVETGTRGADRVVKETAAIDDQILEHGRIEVADFREIVAHVQNDERFDEWGAWGGMIWAAREYYERVSPGDLDEVREIMLEWSEGWSGDHDPEAFEEAWSRHAGRGPGKGQGTTLGTWVFHAREAGWNWPSKPIEVEPEEVDEWGFLGRLDTEEVGTGKTKITRAIANYMNATKIVRHMPKLSGIVGRNILTGGLMRLREWDGTPREYPTEWTDIDMHRTMQAIQGCRKGGEAVFAHFRIEHIKQGIEGGARPVQPVRDMLRSLPKWDCRERLDGWLTRYFGVEDTALTRAYARKFMISLVARGHAMPGQEVKVDTVLVITGKQGMNKSEFFRALAGPGELFADHVGEITKKESAENIAGRWVCEFAEGEVVTKADRRALKGWLTRVSDKYRPSYGRNVQTFPRACVFVMPTNDDEVLNDPTGSRRFWPVTARHGADLRLLKAERAQLLAEAVAAYEAGEPWWLNAAEDEERETRAEDYEVQDALAEPMETILADVIEGQIVSQAEILAALGVEPSKGGNGMVERRMRDLLKKWGWTRAKVEAKRGYRRDTNGQSHPPMSKDALKALKAGEIVPLPVASEFSKIE